MTDLSPNKDHRVPDTGTVADDKKKQKAKPVAAPRKSAQKMESESATESELSDWEIRPFGGKVLMSPPLVKSGGDKSPLGSPHKRSYPPQFDSGLDSTEFNPENYPKRKPQGIWDPEREKRYSANWNNSVSSRDSAISGSLFSTFGSALTESTSSFESASNTEDTASNLSSPTHSVYGRYQKIQADDRGSESESGGSDTEVLVLHRLPGENLGMILGIDKGDSDGRVSKVFVKTVSIGGAAHRATGGTKGIQVGDEILQINGTDINTLTYDECISVLKEMPLRVILSVKRSRTRSAKRSPAESIKSLSSYQNGHSSSQFSESSCYSESEDDSITAGDIEGFTLHRAEVDKDPEESLGLSIVPSYGSTRQYYQIKRLLPSGAASRSSQLRVGDRLVSCNGQSLRSVSQQQCLSILKTEANNGDLEIEVLRQTEDSGQCLEISVQVPNRAGIAGGDSSTLTLRSPNFGKKEFILSEVAETDSDNDVVLSKYNFLEQPRFDKQTQELNGRGVVGNYQSESKENGDLSLNSSASSTEYSKTKKMDNKETADNWAFAVPPPAEFSSFEQAVPPPVEFSEGQSPIFNQSSNQNAPITNIDDIITNYPDAPSEFNQPMKSVHTKADDKDQIDMVADLVGLEEKVRTHSPLPQINEIPSEFDDSYGVRGVKTDQSGHLPGKTVKADKSIIIPDTNVNGFVQTKDEVHLGKDDDADFIVPVSVSRKKLEVVMSTIPKSSEVPRAASPNVEEETIVPDIKTRENSAPPTKSNKSVHSDQSVMRAVSPVMDYKPRQYQKQRPVIQQDSDDENHVSEDAVTPVKVKREDGGKVLEQKLGRDIEETIVKSEVTRDSSWSPAKLVMMTNAWSKSAAKNKDKGKDQNMEDGNKSFKSVIGVFNSLKDDKNREVKSDEANTPALNVATEKETVPVKPETTKEDNATKKSDKEDICVQNEQYNISRNSVSITDNKESAISTIKVESSARDVIPSENTKDKVLDHVTSDSVQQKSVTVSKPEHTKSEEQTKEKDTQNSTSASTHYKTTVSVAKPHSLLGTVRSQNAPSQMKPLSSIKPLTVSAKTFSLGKPGKYSTTISTASGRPSLLSTIHGSSLSSQSKNTRSEDEPFLISVLKGILGIGMKVATTPDGAVQVTEIQNNGPISKDGNVRVGDYILAINNTELTGLQDHKVQQIIRLLPRGIAKILVSVKPPEEWPKSDLCLSPNTSSSSPLSTPSTASPRSPLEVKTSPRGGNISPALSPRQHVKPLVTTPVLDVSDKKHEGGKVTVKHDHSKVSKVDANEDVPSKDSSKVPPVIAKKPSTSGPGHVEASGIGHRKGGYVSSALERKHSFENKPPTVMDRPLLQPRKADYVSSASKVDKSEKEKEPIDTVIFASINPTTKSAPVSSARKSLGEVSSYDLKKPQPEPRIIPKGQIDYISSEKPKKVPPPVSPRTKDSSGGNKAKEVSISPYAYEEPATKKINPVKLNSALSPRRKSQESAFNFGTSFGKGSDKQGNELKSPTSPVASPRTPDHFSSKSPRTPPAVSPKPSPRSKEPAAPSLSHEEHELHGTSSSSTSTSGDSTQESSVAPLPQPETVPVEALDQNTEPDTSLADLNEAEGKTGLLIDVTGASTNILHNTASSTLLSPIPSTEMLLTPCTVQNIQAACKEDNSAQTVQPDNQIIEVNDVQVSVEDSVSKQNEEDEKLIAFAEEIVKEAIQNGIEEMKREQRENVKGDTDDVHSDLSDSEGKREEQLGALVAGSGHEGHSPIHIMDTSPLRAFLEKFDEPPSNPPALPQNEPPVLSSHENHTVVDNIALDTVTESQEINAVADSIAHDMVMDSYQINTVAGSIAHDMVTDSQNESETSLEHSDLGANFNNTPEVAGSLPCDNLTSDSCMSSDVVPPAIPACSVVMDSAESAKSQHVLENSNFDINEPSNARESPPKQEQDAFESQENHTSNPDDDVSEPLHSETLLDIQNSVKDIENKISAVENVLKPLSDIPPEDNVTENISKGNEPNCSEELAAEEEIAFPDNTLDESEDVGIDVSEETGADVMVSKVSPDSLAANEGQVTLSDQIMSVNREPVTLTNEENALISLDSSEGEKVPVVSQNSQEVSEQTVEDEHDNVSKDQVTDSVITETSEPVAMETVEADDADIAEGSNISVPDTAPPPLPVTENDRSNSTADDNYLTNSNTNVSEDSQEIPAPTKEDIRTTPTDNLPDSKTDVIINTEPISVETKSSPPQVNGQSSDSGNETPISPLSPMSTLSIESDDNADDGPKETLEVTMMKGVTGLGFLIEGGKGSPKGDLPLTIRRIFKGGPAEKCGQLRVKDEILMVNGEDITHMKHSTAWNHLKFLDDGEVRLVIRRKVEQ